MKNLSTTRAADVPMSAPDAWRADDSRVAIPVCKPKLPAADRLLPYLRQIDASRRYANHGPLADRFEARLAERAGATSSDQVVVAANATAALTATLMALDLPALTYCLMPSWTFAASGHAVVRAGLIPKFVDVEPDGILSLAAAERCAADTIHRPGAAIVVSPFGLPVDVRAWDAFGRRTGIPVVLDAAAGFDTVRASPVPTVVSLHATKALGIGEGGFVVCTDPERVRAVRERMNFGFADTREALAPAMNAKLSEYSAAIGLAALDEWPAARAAYRRVALDYVSAFDGIAGVRLQRGYGTEWISATTMIDVPADRLARIEGALDEARIGSRRWWGDGLAAQRAFADFARAPLPVTEALATRTLGLPCWPDLATDVIARIAECVGAASRF
jgi:dTDP-4-amino-4,6-dideoxygalactose transaminase